MDSLWMSFFSSYAKKYGASQIAHVPISSAFGSSMLREAERILHEIHEHTIGKQIQGKG
jgi:hypothetical protein